MSVVNSILRYFVLLIGVGAAVRAITFGNVAYLPIMLMCAVMETMLKAHEDNRKRVSHPGEYDRLLELYRNMSQPIEVKGCPRTHWGIADCEVCGLRAAFQANSTASHVADPGEPEGVK